MQIKLKRIYKGDSYTIGHLYINNKYFCDTLEDKVRNLKKEPKIYGKTAIPEGEYEIDMNTISPKFKNRNWAKKWGGVVPRLKNVPYFEGVLIHVGNSAEDSLGCILVGDNQIVGKLVNSTIHFNNLMKILVEANNNKEKITIQIK